MTLMRSTLSALIFLSTLSTLSSFADENQASVRADDKYNLEEQNLGLKGYDPVSYFPEGGSQPQQGNPQILAQVGRVIYFFSSEDNRELFRQNSNKFEPTYGGWCAWAMSNRSYADIDPKLYTLNGNRLHFFISRGAKVRFDNDLKNREVLADEFWLEETNEKPRK